MHGKLHNVLLLIVCAILPAHGAGFERCGELAGAAYGFCVSASHLGCGTRSEQNSNACSRIEDNFFQITGNMPPWLVQCPCFSHSELGDYYEGSRLSCSTTIAGSGPSGDIYYTRLIADGLNTSAVYHSGSKLCSGGPKNTNESSADPDLHQACLDVVLDTASEFRVDCD